MKSSSRCLALCLIVFLFEGCNGFSAPEIKTEKGEALGTTYSIQYEAADSLSIKSELELIFNTVNTSMSTYLPDSDISKINRGDTTIIADDYFKAVFLKAKEVWKNSDGKFDPTVGALVNAWGFGPEKPLNKVSPQQVDSLLGVTGFDKVSLSEDGRIMKTHQAVYLDFNALAKGYTIDLIGRMLHEKGVKNYLVELGGEILAAGINTRTNKNWRIAIDSPLQQEGERSFITRIDIRDKAIATSGNYRKFRTDPETGMRYAHIIHPKTGYPQKSNVLSVSVIANTCMEADAYATAFMVMETEEIKTLARRLTSLEVYVVYNGGSGKLVTYATKGFEACMVNEYN